MSRTYIETAISAELDHEIRWMFEELIVQHGHPQIARIYDDVLTKVKTQLYPIWKHQDEYWDDQKMLYHFVVQKIVRLPEVVLARNRFKNDLEDFFREKPDFQWKGLWLKELLDLSINIPLTLGDLTKLIATKTGQFILLKFEKTSYSRDARKHAVQDDSVSDGHIMSSSRLIFLPFLRFVRTGPDYDHPVFITLYAYLMLVLDMLYSIFQHTKHPRAQNLLSKMLPIRAELLGVIHMSRPKENLRQSIVRIKGLIENKADWETTPPG